MSNEYLPVGVKCNLKCSYCYQEEMRIAGNYAPPTDFEKAKERLRGLTSQFAMFGGEPLLTPFDQLEEIFKIGLEKFGSNSIQTNGVLMTPKHIKLFKKYKVGVGVSIDGPGECNSPRCSPEETEATLANIRRLSRAKIGFSIIVTIHRENFKRLPLLRNFLVGMEKLGVQTINLHHLELDYQAHEIALTPLENATIFKQLYLHSQTSKIPFHPFEDIKNLLKNSGPSNCVWNACDPLTTPAVHGIGADGELTNCGRTNKDGIDWAKTEGEGKERYIALWNTPQEVGGCKDCRYFFACKGQCPGTAIGGDWRNRTRDCQFFYDLIGFIEDEEGIPVSYPERNQAFVKTLMAQSGSSGHGDIPHSDTPHGDMHGDHTDSSLLTQARGVKVTWKD